MEMTMEIKAAGIGRVVYPQGMDMGAMVDTM